MRRLVGVAASAACLAGLLGTSTAISDARSENSSSIRVAPVVELSDHSVSVNDPDVQSRLNAVSADQERWRAGAKARYATGESGIVIRYVSPTPGDVQAVMEQVVDDFESVLDFGDASAVVEFNWTDLGPNVLGSAGPYTLHSYEGRWESAALVNVLTNTDANGGANPEMVITLNSNFSWHRSTSVNSGDKFDLYSVALHEMAHGLGFLGAATDDGDGDGEFSPYLMGYDDQILHGANKLQTFADPGVYLQSDNLYFDIGGGRRQQIHAPDPFVAGSSYSHFEDDAIAFGGPGRLMVPALLQGESNRNIDAPVLGVLAQIGWPVSADPLLPSTTGFSQVGDTLEIRWSIDLSQSGTVPKSFRVTAVPDEGDAVVKLVPGSATRTSLVVSSGGGYDIQVAAVSRDGHSVAAPANRVIVSDPQSDGPPVDESTGGSDCESFTDIGPERFDFKGICYLLKSGVSKGTSARSYSPDGVITRGQYAVLSYRAAGSPDISSCSLDFTDVDPSRFDYDGICYLVIRGVSQGTSETTYSPDAPITRGQYAVLTQRAKDTRAAGCGAESPQRFADVDSSRFDFRAICWLVESGVSQGMTATTYEPDGAITRGQYAALAYRSSTS